MDRLKRKGDARKPPKGRLKKLRTKGSGDGENTVDCPDSKENVEDNCRRGSAQLVDSRLWVEKYTPTNEKDLAVHSKKVAEVKEWIQEQVQVPSKAETQRRMLVLTGPAGVGKTAVIHTLAKSMDIELLEWTTPTPTLWHEYSHHAATGVPYTSKIEDFEVFVDKARKFGSLPTVAAHALQQQRTSPGLAELKPSRERTKLLLIDDLPNAHDKAHRERLCGSLHALATCSEFPTVLIITDEVGTGEQLDQRKVVTNEIIQGLERAGAKKIAFNPITVNGIQKVLNRVQLTEKCKAPLGCLSAIAESCAGDIRQALMSLQFMCHGYDSYPSHSSIWDPGGGRRNRTNAKLLAGNSQKLQSHQADVPGRPGLGDRDLSLSLFHALGKLLHNKRQSEVLAQASNCDSLKLKEEYCRNPLKMAEPETILSQAHAETETVAAFLHENFLQFVDEEATDDVSAMSAYLSDTDCLLGGEGIRRFRRAALNFNDIEPVQVANAAASSVAARGVLFSNVHPAPPRWQSLRAPFLWQVERQQVHKKSETYLAFSGVFLTSLLSSSVLNTELYPYRYRLPIQSSASSLPKEENDMPRVETLFVDEDEMEVDGTSEETAVVKGNCYVVEPNPAEMDIEDEIEEW